MTRPNVAALWASLRVSAQDVPLARQQPDAEARLPDVGLARPLPEDVGLAEPPDAAALRDALAQAPQRVPGGEARREVPPGAEARLAALRSAAKDAARPRVSAARLAALHAMAAGGVVSLPAQLRV